MHFYSAVVPGVFSIVFYLYYSNFLDKFQRVSYVAATVEYQPESPWNSSPQELIAKNVENYKNLIEEAAFLDSDIIVFPEYGLTTLGIPRNREDAKPYLLSVPQVAINPCAAKLGSEGIQGISCAASTFSIYVVINVGEIRPCSPGERNCPQDGRFQFNTNIAFDRDGTIVAKYEKGNLYFEDQFDKPNPTKLSSFVSDFGVEFGLFTCFDIIFHDPAVILAENGINNFIMPTAWVDELPFLTAIQSQAMWAYSLNVNLLASGYHQPLGGQLGSGIYSGRYGALNYTFDPESGTKIIISQVHFQPDEAYSNELMSSIPKNVTLDPSTRAFKTFHNYLREDLQNYTTKILKLTPTEVFNETVCVENGFCCQVRYQMKLMKDSSSTSMEIYRLIAFNGTRTVAAKTAHYNWQVCGIVRCLNETLESCSENDNNSYEILPNFLSFELNSKFDLHKENMFFPGLNALDVKFNLIPYDYFQVYSNPEDHSMQISSNLLHSVDINTIAMVNKLYNVASLQDIKVE